MEHVIKAVTSPQISERERRNASLAREAAAEGFVLLKNNGMLPLKTRKVALYGSGAGMTVAGGAGSGAMHQRYSVSIAQGLENNGFEVTTKGWLARYEQYYRESYAAWKQGIEKQAEGLDDVFAVLKIAIGNRFQYPAGVEIERSDMEESDTDTAIYVIARHAGEGGDRSDTEGDFRLDMVEYESLKRVSEYYRHTMAVVNVGGLIDLSFMDELDIDALMFYAQGGMEGGNAFADVVSGKTPPSGKLACTWAHKYSDYPSSATYSHYGNPREQNYREGIFIGYRYFDSFDVKPRYEFGYGLSYTQFEIAAGQVTEADGSISIKAAVKNVGHCEGREVVQAYVTMPRTESRAEYQRLVAYKKTRLLSPGESERLKLTFDMRDCSYYSEGGDDETGSFMLEKGYYILRVGNSSRNTGIPAILHLRESVKTEICARICRDEYKVTELVPAIQENMMTEDEIIRAVCAGGPEARTYCENPPCILELEPSHIRLQTHTYEELPVYTDSARREIIDRMDVRELAALVTGSGLHSDNLVTVLGASGNTTSTLYEKYGIPNIVLSDGPAGLNVTPELVVTDGGEIKSTQMYPQYDFGDFGKIMRKKLGTPNEGVMHYQYATAWPVGMLLAQTWNTDLIERIGEAVGVEMLEFGVSVWLAPGINLYRSPLCGRSFEYYSEDPLVAGRTAAAVIRGVQRREGLGVSLKHFVCNNSENDRDLSSSNVDERTLRELYLRAFRIAVEEGRPRTLMAAYNKINGVYATNNSDLLIKVLRNEWGFDGLVMSDWNAVDIDRGDAVLAVKAQCDLLMPGKKEWTELIIRGVEDGTLALDDLKRCASRVLGLVSENKARAPRFA